MRPIIATVSLLLAAGLFVSGCAPAPAPVQPADVPATPARVRADRLNLLKCPSLDCDDIEDLHAGQHVLVLSPNMNGWRLVRVPETGHEGYVQAGFLGQ